MSFFAAGTWAAIAAGAAVAGAGYSAYSTYQVGKQQQAMGEWNAKQQEGQNQFDLAASAAKSLQERQENEKIMAAQEAAWAASGVVTNTGSPLLVKARQSALLERRALNTDYEAAVGSRVGAGKVAAYRFDGQMARKASRVQSTATLLSGAGNAASFAYGASK